MSDLRLLKLPTNHGFGYTRENDFLCVKGKRKFLSKIYYTAAGGTNVFDGLDAVDLYSLDGLYVIKDDTPPTDEEILENLKRKEEPLSKEDWEKLDRIVKLKPESRTHR